jgi:hypothetical protein
VALTRSGRPPWVPIGYVLHLVLGGLQSNHQVFRSTVASADSRLGFRRARRRRCPQNLVLPADGAGRENSTGREKPGCRSHVFTRQFSRVLLSGWAGERGDGMLTWVQSWPFEVQT